MGHLVKNLFLHKKAFTTTAADYLIADARVQTIDGIIGIYMYSLGSSFSIH